MFITFIKGAEKILTYHSNVAMLRSKLWERFEELGYVDQLKPRKNRSKTLNASFAVEINVHSSNSTINPERLVKKNPNRVPIFEQVFDNEGTKVKLLDSVYESLLGGKMPLMGDGKGKRNRLKESLLVEQMGLCAFCGKGIYCPDCFDGKQHGTHEDGTIKHRWQFVDHLDHNHSHEGCNGCEVCVRGLVHNFCNWNVIPVLQRNPQLQNEAVRNYLNRGKVPNGTQ